MARVGVMQAAGLLSQVGASLRSMPEDKRLEWTRAEGFCWISVCNVCGGKMPRPSPKAGPSVDQLKRFAIALSAATAAN